jgi:arginyl-tRNA synthetase
MNIAPHYIATYLIELAAEFNAYYAKNKIVDSKDPCLIS